MDEIWIVAITGVVGTLLGTAAGALFAWKLDEIRWSREEAVWSRKDRHHAYVSFLEGMDRFAWSAGVVLRAADNVLAIGKKLQEVPEEQQDESEWAGFKKLVDDAVANLNRTSDTLDVLLRATSGVRIIGSSEADEAAREVWDAGLRFVESSRQEGFDRNQWLTEDWHPARDRFLEVARQDLGIEDI